MKIILAAVQQLLKFKGFATFAEIASVSGKKKMEVLECLNANSNLLNKDKSGRITGLADVITNQRAMDYHAGRTYYARKINYGCDTAIACLNPVVDSLRQTYYSGGFGDSSASQEILYTPENVAAIEALGVVEYSKPEVKQIEELWEE